MLSELDETIRQLLIKAGDLDPAEIDVSFDIPNREWSAGISKPTVNCYLFDIRENAEMRQHGMQMERPGTNSAARRRPPVYFDLTYLVTAWTRAVEDEHRLLWHALRTLMRFGTMPAEYLQGALREMSGPIYTRTAQPNGVLKSPGEFWTALENQLKPSLAYVVTLAFDRDAFPAGPPVFSTTLRFRQGDATPEEMRWFGGTVRDEAGAPVGGATVEVEDHAFRAVTDAEGRFRLRVPRPGRYTLLARMDGTTQRRDVEIDAASYDMTLPTQQQPSRDGASRRGSQKGGSETT